MATAIAYLFLSWSRLEDSMVMVLHSVLGDNGGRIASAIYYTINNFETRLRAVSAAVDEHLRLHQPRSAILIPHWTTFQNAMRRYQSCRNTVAHGKMKQVESRKKVHIRIVGPLLDFRAHEANFKPGQLNGFSINDVQVAHKAMWNTSIKLDFFGAALRALRSSEEKELSEALAQLRADPQG